MSKCNTCSRGKSKECQICKFQPWYEREVDYFSYNRKIELGLKRIGIGIGLFILTMAVIANV